MSKKDLNFIFSLMKVVEHNQDGRPIIEKIRLEDIRGISNLISSDELTEEEERELE